MKDSKEFDDTFLARWLDGSLSPDELRAFEQSEDYVLYAKIARESSHLKPPSWNKQASWENIEQATTKKGRRIALKPILYMAAASLALLLAAIFLFQDDSMQEYATLVKEKRNIELPDGSKVSLNAASNIRFEENSFLKDRRIQLEGEAFFEVEKGSSFIVETAQGQVEVLGTSFNVLARNQYFQVQCYTGKVGVESKASNKNSILEAGDRIAYTADRITNQTRLKEALEQPAWKGGHSVFIDADIQEVLDELARQYEIDIQTDRSTIFSGRFNGGFPHTNLNTALEIICRAIQYEYTIDGKLVRLSEKK